MSDTVGLTKGLPTHIRPGAVIAGKYRLEEEIGRGSMGTVFRAAHVTLGQRVAIKLISAEHSQSGEARKRFRVEAQAAAKLRSRHVVSVYDHGETADGNPYIVLELLEGETLEQRLLREHDLPLADAVRIVSHVARALARAHAQGIVHRDLKPANVFLVKSDDDEVGWLAKVLDFGIAKLAGQGDNGTTQAGTVLGTALFMSPEQVRGASTVDHRADLYSLGICLYQMLTGDLPFAAATSSEILVGICTLPLPRLREKAPWAPEAVELWFQRACAKDPLERFQSADEMTEALQVASGGVTLSKHKSVPEGRIAPETLMGYAAPPALTMLNPEAGAGLGGTHVIPPHSAAAPPPIPIVLGSSTSPTGAEWLPRKLGLRPLFVGAGLGLLVVVGFTVAFKWLTRSEASPAPASAVSARGAVAPSLTPTTTAASIPLPLPAQSVTPVSSVTGEPHVPAVSSPRVAATPHPPKTSPARPKPTRAPSTPGKPANADLGF